MTLWLEWLMWLCDSEKKLKKYDAVIGVIDVIMWFRKKLKKKTKKSMTLWLAWLTWLCDSEKNFKKYDAVIGVIDVIMWFRKKLKKIWRCD